MNGSSDANVELTNGILAGMPHSDSVKLLICPPFSYLSALAQKLADTELALGAQNVSQFESGAYTGEVSPGMLAELCEYVILGHSERRQHFWETDEFINRKVRAALAARLRPILCVGEGLEERQEGLAESVVTAQLRGALNRVSSAETLAVAYEPIWAIGTGVAATGEAAEDIMGAIRRTLTELYGEAAAKEIPLLYGGSVTPDNVAEYASQPNVNGALVGGASLDAGRFAEIARGMAAG